MPTLRPASRQICTALFVAAIFGLPTFGHAAQQEQPGAPTAQAAEAIKSAGRTLDAPMDSGISLGLKAYADKDYGKAARLFKDEADRGNPTAQFFLGVLYTSGKGVSKNGAKGVALLKNAADGGVVKAQTYLGYFYFTGDAGLQEDHAEALSWFQRAGRKGDQDAQEMTGMLLLATKDPDNYNAAAQWLERSLEPNKQLDDLVGPSAKDHKQEAKMLLGQMFLSGSGVPQNNALAYALFSNVTTEVPFSITAHMSQADIQLGRSLAETMRHSGDIPKVINSYISGSPSIGNGLQ